MVCMVSFSRRGEARRFKCLSFLFFVGVGGGGGRWEQLFFPPLLFTPVFSLLFSSLVSSRLLSSTYPSPPPSLCPIPSHPTLTPSPATKFIISHEPSSPFLLSHKQASPPTPSTSKPRPPTSTPTPCPSTPCSTRSRRRARPSGGLRRMGRGWGFRFD